MRRVGETKMGGVLLRNAEGNNPEILREDWRRGKGEEFLRAPLREGGRLRGEGEDGPNFLHTGNGFRAGAEAQAQLAAEAAHPTRQMHQQEPVLLKSCGTFFRREAQPLDGAGKIR